MKNFKIVLTEEQIEQRVRELGEEITRDYQGKSPVFICMLKGAVLFFTDLVKRVELPVSFEFARLSSYKNGTESGEMEVVNDITADISGKDVIIVEDVVDSGKTLAFFAEMLKKKHPASIKICSFLDKPDRRVSDINVDYVGFKLHCGFVIGYGMDYAERFRDLPYLAEINSPADLED